MRLLEVDNLTKSYGNKTVVSNVSLSVKRGEVVGLLGPNGAGKTTTFYMVVGIISPDAGQISFDNRNITYTPI
ncbi:MAG: ATP-binding cassette domain-containing protein, partial [Candidatus Omnitrophica bacterium]|nr:ATP-binding cassette domain-containing protein [Candidatus Omnitrophota bacterium]